MPSTPAPPFNVTARTRQCTLNTSRYPRRSEKAKSKGNATLKYVLIEEPSIHVRVYAADEFQNLCTKNCQISFAIFLADQHGNVNINHWNSLRAPRRSNSTEQAELISLYISFRTLENISHINDSFLRRTIPVAVYRLRYTLV